MAPKASRHALGAVLDALPFGIALTLLAALPAFFNLATHQIFEEQKSLLLRAAALLAVPGTLAWLWRGDTRRLLRRPSVCLFFALVAVIAMATVLSGAGHDALFGAYLRRHGLATWLAVAVLFAAMLSAARSPDARALIVRAAMVGGAWPAAYLLMQAAGVDPLQWIAPNEGHQSGSTFGNHVLIGGYLATVIPLAILEAWRSHRAWTLLAALQGAALIASGSRGAVLAALAGGIMACGVVLWRFAPRRIAIVAAMAFVVVGVAAVVVVSQRPAFIERLNPQVGSARVRVLIWQGTAGILRDSGARLWLGHGPDSLRALFPGVYSAEIGTLEQIDAMPDRAHNEVLDMLVSAGVLGAVLELCFFAAVLLAALRAGDVRVRAALAAAIVAHIVEIQFGIASASSRLLIVALTAVVAGSELTTGDTVSGARSISTWILIAAIAGALSPWLSMLPSQFSQVITSGGEEQFIQYLRGLSAGTPAIYLGGLAIATGIAYAVAHSRRASITAWWQLPALVAMAWLTLPLSIVPSRADGYMAAATAFEQQRRWPESTIAYGAAVHDAPNVADYHDGLARASIQWALDSELQQRDRLLAQARASYERALALERFEPLYARHLAGYFRIRASLRDGAARDEALLEADRIYSGVTSRAPRLTSLWVEWAWVDVDRGRIADALAKLDTALALHPQRTDALELRSRLLAEGTAKDAR